MQSYLQPCCPTYSDDVLPIAMMSSWSHGSSRAKGPLYSSRPSTCSVMNSSDTWLSKHGASGGNHA